MQYTYFTAYRNHGAQRGNRARRELCWQFEDSLVRSNRLHTIDLRNENSSISRYGKILGLGRSSERRLAVKYGSVASSVIRELISRTQNLNR